MRELKYMKLFLLLFAVVMLAPGCQSNKSSSSDVDHALIRYWDDFDFTDTATVMNPEIGEQKLVDFIAEFPNVSDTVRTLAIHRMLYQAQEEPLSIGYVIKQFDHYLYDPNSPMRNDLYYEPVLAFMADSADLMDYERTRYRNLLDLVRKNQVGHQASDFMFVSPNGGNANLYESEALFTLLFFYEPGCPSCETAIDQMGSSSIFQQLSANEKLEVLAIYPYGDLEIWREYQDRIPAYWTNGFDRRSQIITDGLYDIRATPTIYLLDENKKVLLKDTDLAQLARFLTKYMNHS